MRHTIFIKGGSETSEIFRWSDERLAVALRESADLVSRVGAVYLGKVTAIDPMLGAAFVDLGLEKAGLLPFKKRGAPPTEGQVVIVQVRRDGWGDKGPRLSLDIRTEAALPENAIQMPAPCLLAPPPPLWSGVLSELDPASVADIVCDRRVDYLSVIEWCRRHALELVPRVRVEPIRQWSPARDDALDAIAMALEESFMLPCGGTLLFEPMRTLTAIDVNSSAALASSLEVNLQAAEEIPRQLALRNHGGIIVVDFIDPKQRKDRGRVIERLRAAAEIDPAIEWIGNLSALGLVEMRRRRRGFDLAAMWSSAVNGVAS